jgi:hypothetical protein
MQALPLLLAASAALVPGERFPLGPLGATAEVEAGSSHAVLVQIDENGAAARAGLQVGDRLDAVAGQAFPAHGASIDDGGRGPQKCLGEAIDAACIRSAEEAAEQTEPRLRFGVLRGEEKLELELAFPWRPALSGPRRSEGRRALRSVAAAQLLERRAQHGAWDSPVGLSGDRVISAWATLALLAHDDPAQREAVDAAALWLKGPKGRAWLPDDYSKGPDNLGNWALTSAAVALAEHDRARESKVHQAVLEHIASGLAARMGPEGRFGHDVSVGYRGKGFNVINTLSHLAWASAADRGVTLDETAWKKSLEQIRLSVDPNHGVRYWTMGGTGTGDASLRTASMAIALHLCGREPVLAEGFVRYLDTHAPRTREAHAVGSLGMLLAAPALRADSLATWERFVEEWRWYLCLMWDADRRLHYIGGKGNNGGDSYLGFDLVAAVIALQVLACEDAPLAIHRKRGAL